MCTEASDDELVTPVEPTPDTNPGDFENLRGTKAKKNKKTGEIYRIQIYCIKTTGRSTRTRKISKRDKETAQFGPTVGLRNNFDSGFMKMIVTDFEKEARDYYPVTARENC
jgi:hypothetical protein